MSSNKIFTVNSKASLPNEEGQKDSDQRFDIQNSSNGNYWIILHILTILIVSGLSLSPQLLIPRHNSIYYPDYWQEVLIIVTMGCLCAFIRMMMECVVFTKEKSLIRFSFFMKLFVSGTIPYFVVFYSSHYIWTSVSGFENPVPLGGIIGHLIGYLITICCLRFMVASKVVG